MSGITFTKAVKHKEKLRLALDGPAGYGKTWTALVVGTYLAQQEGGRIAVIDSERSSAKKYASAFDFDHAGLPDFNPHTYMAAVRAAVDAGYAVIIIDSFSHAWEGVLEVKDNATARSKSKNSFTEGWREATPLHNELVDTVLRADAHIIATLRTKVEYVIDESGRPNKIGMKPIQREGVDFEFDIVGDMTAENSLVVSKTRCPDIAGKVFRKPDERFAETIWRWLDDGEDAPPPPPPTVTSASAKRRVLDACDGDRDRARAAWTFGDAAEVDAAELADLLAALTSHDPFDDDPDPDGPGKTSASAEGEQTTKEASGASSVVAEVVDGSPAPTEGALGSPTAGEGDEASTATLAEEPAPAEGDIDAATRRRLFALVTECCPAAENLSSEANDEVRKRWLLRLVQALDSTAVPLESRSLISERSARKAALACEEITEGRATYEDFVEGRVRVQVRANGGLTVQRKRGKAA